ncbi:MAG: two-component system activity regulator YycH [Paenisporosarcina sp.]|nr:two-component system activity regulator YycH [Paenisporosarcina sp.]
MGLKYIEHVKSAILFLLVVLSISLTFTIWTYTPSYPISQDAPVVDISIADRKRINEVVKPYKLVFSLKDGLTGTSAFPQVERVLGVMKEWEIRDLTLINNNISPAELNEYSHKSNRFTLLYPADIPFSVFDNIIPFSNTNIPEVGFDRMVVDWNHSNDELDVFFASSVTKQIYSAKATKVNRQQFQEKIVLPAVDFPKYTEVQRNEKITMFVPIEEIASIRYTYILKEVPPARFKDALFDNPNKVRRSFVGTYNEEFSDDTALMTVDSLDRTLSYVYPAAESNVSGIPSKLVFDSMDFVNEHEGWTDDYRLVGINPKNQKVDYQLFLLGYPVFSDMTSTTISTYWGTNRIFRYIRPYFTLDLSLPSETDAAILPSGPDAAKMVEQVESKDGSKITGLTVGYYLTRDDERGLLNLEPSWFYLANGVWTRLAPETIGGGKFGLE